MRIFLGLFLSAALAAGAAAQPKTLSDAEAREIMTNDWNNLIGWLLTGERSVAQNSPGADCKREQLNPGQFEFLLNAERAGLVTIQYSDGALLQERNYTNKQILEFAVSGKLGKFTVLPTKAAEAEKIRLDVNGRIGCMSFKIGDYAIETVTGNRAFRKATTDLAEVAVNYRVTYAPIYAKIYGAAKIHLGSARHANVLFRFDPARKRWHILAFDAANAGEAIRPENIPAALEKIR